jgi:hypothetical protein
MSALLKSSKRSAVVHSIEEHPAWSGNIPFDIEQDIQLHAAYLGRVSGLKAEKMVRKATKPYQYVLRAGETELDYYVTFSLPDGTVKHQPFVVTLASEGWSYENYCVGGPFKHASIDDVLHLIMHCHKSECSALEIKD